MKVPSGVAAIGRLDRVPEASISTRSSASTVPRATCASIEKGSRSSTSTSPGDRSCSQVAGGMSAVGSRSRASVTARRSPSVAWRSATVATRPATQHAARPSARHGTIRRARNSRIRSVVSARSRSTSRGRVAPPVVPPPRARSTTVSSRLCMPPSTRSIRRATASSDGRRYAGRRMNAAQASATESHQPPSTAMRPATGRGAARSRSTPPTIQATAAATASRRPVASTATSRPLRVRDTTRATSSRPRGVAAPGSFMEWGAVGEGLDMVAPCGSSGGSTGGR